MVSSRSTSSCKVLTTMYAHIELSWEKTDNKPVMVIGATNRPDALDPALRRAGRFDHEIGMTVPDDEARAQCVCLSFIKETPHSNIYRILRVLCAKLRLDGEFDFNALAKATPGYVGADLSALTGAAGIIAVKRIFKNLSDATIVPGPLPAVETDTSMQIDVDATAVSGPPTPSPEALPFAQLASSLTHSPIARFLQSHPGPLTPALLAPICITADDFMLALKEVQPSAQREGFATVPDVTWADVGALHATRSELHMAVVQPIRRPELFLAVGIDAPAGVLLWGPPGCGKTLLAKAVANESQASFISVKGPELLNKVRHAFLHWRRRLTNDRLSTSGRASVQCGRCSRVRVHRHRASFSLTSSTRSSRDVTRPYQSPRRVSSTRSSQSSTASMRGVASSSSARQTVPTCSTQQCAVRGGSTSCSTSTCPRLTNAQKSCVRCSSAATSRLRPLRHRIWHRRTVSRRWSPATVARGIAAPIWLRS
jgi:hypothetical protein